MQLSTIVGVLFAMLLVGCEKRSDDPFMMLPGVYELYVDPKAEVHRRDLVSSRLTVMENGSFTQTCTYRDKTPLAFEGFWRPLENNVWFEPFKDCAGVWAQDSAGEGKGASLIIKESPPIILLDPDVNVFYRQIGKD